MSSDYFFKKWKETLTRLEVLVHLDLEYQKTKAHDKKRCAAVIRLSGVQGEYIVVYNMALDCLQHNIQVQKTQYMLEVVKAVTNRIIELKREIRKLECSNAQFLGHGLANHKMTTYDAELEDVPTHIDRPDNVNTAIAEAFIKAEQRKLQEILDKEADEKEGQNVPVHNWWDENISDVEVIIEEKDENPKTEEMIQTKQMAALIQAHERSRQVIRNVRYANQKRELWKKKLQGTLKPPLQLDLRSRAAILIQKVCRAYFEIKRKKKYDCLRDEKLGISLCKQVDAWKSKTVDIKQLRFNQREEFEKQWKDYRERLRQDFEKSRKRDHADDYRDFIREWYRKWFDDIQYFHDIPKDKDGGSVLIMKCELPEPTEWWETYLTYLEEKKANKNKSALQLKWAQMEAKQEELMIKKEKRMREKLEAELIRKIMKNPTLHPGFIYPESKKTEHILEVIQKYRNDWDEIDQSEVLEAKKKFVTDVDKHNIYATVKMNIMQLVDQDMREELKVLKKALKKDYESNGMKFPEPMKKPKKRVKQKKKIVKVTISESVAEKMEDLAFKGILKKYPPTALGDFLGDHNYAGDDQRCKYETAVQFCGETRSIWWERCLEASRGHHKVLLVGLRHSGKTLLVHALATVTDAILFELDPSNIHTVAPSSHDLQRIVNAVVTCARAAQPSVIYIKHIHRLFYRKVPKEDAHINLDLMRRLLVRKLLKKTNKTDKITVIGSCADPWLTKNAPLLKLFPMVVLVPDTSYSSVFRLLKHWINENHSIPRSLDINSLAYVLRGYSYGQLREGLLNFLTPERVIKIAARGLIPMEIYDYFLEDETKIKVDYGKYQKWYTDKTQWGKREKKHIKKQREFHLLSQKYAEKAKKKQPSAVSSATTVQSGV